MKNFFIVLVLFISQMTFAGVNLKNGNFYINYTDVIVPGGGNDLEVVRTYNSKSTEKGWFGYGWGSDYETKLDIAADGSIVIFENGSGARTRFTPKTPINAEASANEIIKAMGKKVSISEEVAKNLRVRLVNDAELRMAYGKKFSVKTTISSGSTLYSSLRGKQRIVKLENGFQRFFDENKSQFFDEEGKLLKIQDKNGQVIDLNYDGNKLVSIKDNQAKQLFFEWYNNGRVKSISPGGDKKSNYTFENDNLISSVDMAGNTYKYSYDGNHNMREISYEDGKKMTIAYSSKDQFAEKIVDKNGEETKYRYENNPKNPDHHYWTFVTKKDGFGKELTNKFEYEVKVRPDGSEYTYRILTDINGLITETTYSECCGLPLKIARGDEVTTFEYNPRGLLTKKSSNKGEFTQLEYHEKFNKVTKVVSNEGWSQYEYDSKGQLQKATNEKGRAVLIVYDLKGRITQMVDFDKGTKNKRALSFKYNALGKPSEIKMANVGKILVDYDGLGAIKKVQSEKGDKMAVQVTDVFQSLLEIVRPAGVTLNM